jgi:hypothetical protein
LFVFGCRKAWHHQSIQGGLETSAGVIVFVVVFYFVVENQQHHHSHQQEFFLCSLFL